ncbi:MAG: MFS transporter [Dehalococcoidales bacterium]|nr:MFS transporter [Dehalococcoidales bacterium]
MFYGWYIIVASVIIILYTGGIVHFGFTAVFEPIAQEFGWSYAQISLATSLRGLEQGLLAPLVGFLVDRWGPRRLIFAGSIFVCFGFIILSNVSSLAMYYGAFVLISAGFSACTGTVLITAVNNWFRRRAGLATGIVASGFGLGGLLVPVVTKLIEVFQWRRAVLTVGLGMLGVVLPLSFVVRHKPEQYGYQPDGDLSGQVEAGEDQPSTLALEASLSARQALSSRSFWHIGISSACHSFVIGAVVTHMMPYLSSLGIARSVSSVIALLLPVSSIPGRLGSGWLADKFGSRRVFTASFLAITAGLFLFSSVTSGGLWLLVPFIIAFSLGWGTSVTSRLSFLREYYGRDSFGTILGFTSGIMMAGNIGGTPLAGWVFDTWGNYQGAWLGFGALTLAGAVLVATIPAPNRAIDA